LHQVLDALHLGQVLQGVLAALRRLGKMRAPSASKGGGKTRLPPYMAGRRLNHMHFNRPGSRTYALVQKTSNSFLFIERLSARACTKSLTRCILARSCNSKGGGKTRLPPYMAGRRLNHMHFNRPGSRTYAVKSVSGAGTSVTARNFLGQVGQQPGQLSSRATSQTRLPIMHVSGLLRGKTTDQVAGQLALKSSVRSHLFPGLLKCI
jgi:hypothetical protein